MHKDRIAEWLLALVTDQERAASTVGDLMEHARVRGALWFWSSLLRTMAALTWRSFAVEPRKFIWGGFLASLRAMVLANLAQLAVVLGFLIVTIAGHAIFGPPGPVDRAQFLRGWVVWPYYGAIWGAPAWVLYRAGRWAAGRMPGKELTAGLAFFGMTCVLGTISGAALLELDAHGIRTPSGEHWYPSMGILALTSINAAAFIVSLAGAVSARRRTAVH